MDEQINSSNIDNSESKKSEESEKNMNPIFSKSDANTIKIIDTNIIDIDNNNIDNSLPENISENINHHNDNGNCNSNNKDNNHDLSIENKIETLSENETSKKEPSIDNNTDTKTHTFVNISKILLKKLNSIVNLSNIVKFIKFVPKLYIFTFHAALIFIILSNKFLINILNSINIFINNNFRFIYFIIAAVFSIFAISGIISSIIKITKSNESNIKISQSKLKTKPIVINFLTFIFSIFLFIPFIFGNSSNNSSSFLATSSEKSSAISSGEFSNIEETQNIQENNKKDIKLPEGYIKIPDNLSNITAIFAGGDNNKSNHVAAIKNDGTVIAWGNNKFSQCNVPEGLKDVTSLALGKTFTAALKKDGTVSVWGSIKEVKEGLKNVQQICAGSSHIVALKEDGTVIAWGDNSLGQCNVPENLSNVVYLRSSPNSNHTVALKEDGTVVAWGDNSSGQCNVPEGLKEIKAIYASYNCSGALREDDSIIIWKKNMSKYEFLKDTLTQVKSAIIRDPEFFPSCIVLKKGDGSIEVIGNDMSDEIGKVPAGIKNIKEISAGREHMVALTENGSLIAWGNNKYGQCDVGKFTNNVKSAIAWAYFTVILKTDGTVCMLNPEFLPN